MRRAAYLLRAVVGQVEDGTIVSVNEQQEQYLYHRQDSRKPHGQAPGRALSELCFTFIRQDQADEVGDNDRKGEQELVAGAESPGEMFRRYLVD